MGLFDLSSVTLLQWIAFVFGVLYITFAAYDKHQCWLYSFISTIALAIEDFVHLRLYVDSAVQVFYALVALCGLYVWISSESKSKRDIRISSLDGKRNLSYLLIILIMGIALGYLMDQHSDAALPYLDSITSMLAIVGTFLMVYHFIDSWYYLIVVNVACIYLYYARDAHLLSILYLVYTVLTVIGLIKWREKKANQVSKYSFLNN